MQNNRVWELGCGFIRTVVEGVRYDDKTCAIIVSVRPNAKARSRCGRCGRRSPRVMTAATLAGSGCWDNQCVCRG